MVTMHFHPDHIILVKHTDYHTVMFRCKFFVDVDAM